MQRRKRYAQISGLDSQQKNRAGVIRLRPGGFAERPENEVGVRADAGRLLRWDFALSLAVCRGLLPRIAVKLRDKRVGLSGDVHSPINDSLGAGIGSI